MWRVAYEHHYDDYKRAETWTHTLGYYKNHLAAVRVAVMHDFTYIQQDLAVNIDYVVSRGSETGDEKKKKANKEYMVKARALIDHVKKLPKVTEKTCAKYYEEWNKRLTNYVGETGEFTSQPSGERSFIEFIDPKTIHKETDVPEIPQEFIDTIPDESEMRKKKKQKIA